MLVAIFSLTALPSHQFLLRAVPLSVALQAASPSFKTPVLTRAPVCCIHDSPDALLLRELHVCFITNSPADMLLQELMTPFESTPAASHGTTDQVSAPLSSCLEDLPQSILVELCQAGAAHRMPLTVALVSEKSRQQAAALDSLAWRDLVAGTLALQDLL